MSTAMFARSASTAFLAVATMLLLFRFQGSISLGELLAVAVSASLLCSAGHSLIRGPRQFGRALFERARYLIVVPICALLMLGLLLFRVAFLLFKIALKAALALALWLVYLISPIDLIPDFIPVIGLIDDIAFFVAICVWAASAGVNHSLRSSVAILRPSTSFP